MRRLEGLLWQDERCAKIVDRKEVKMEFAVVPAACVANGVLTSVRLVRLQVEGEVLDLVVPHFRLFAVVRSVISLV